MVQLLLDKYKLYKNRKNFKCTLRLTRDRCEELKHMTYKELCGFLKENEGVKFHNFIPSHIENKIEFHKKDYVTILYKNGEFHFMGPLMLCKSYNDLESIGFRMRFEEV